MQQKSEACCRCGAPARTIKMDSNNPDLHVLVCTLCDLPCDSCRCSKATMSDEDFDEMFEPCIVV